MSEIPIFILDLFQLISLFLFVLIVIVMIMVTLINFILLCKYTGQIISFVDDYKNIQIKRLGLAKTHMSMIEKAGNYIAHWDLICEDELGNQYIIYTNKFKDDPKLTDKIKSVESMLLNNMILEGNRSVFIEYKDNLPWKYKRDKMYDLQRLIPLSSIVEIFSENLQNKYNVVDYNCFHNCKKTVESFCQIDNPYFSIKQKYYTLPNLLTDIVNVI